MTFDRILLMYLIKILLMLGVIAALCSITAGHIGCAASQTFFCFFSPNKAKYVTHTKPDILETSKSKCDEIFGI